MEFNINELLHMIIYSKKFNLPIIKIIRVQIFSNLDHIIFEIHEENLITKFNIYYSLQDTKIISYLNVLSECKNVNFFSKYENAFQKHSSKEFLFNKEGINERTIEINNVINETIENYFKNNMEKYETLKLLWKI